MEERKTIGFLPFSLNPFDFDEVCCLHSASTFLQIYIFVVGCLASCSFSVILQTFLCDFLQLWIQFSFHSFVPAAHFLYRRKQRSKRTAKVCASVFCLHRSKCIVLLNVLICKGSVQNLIFRIYCSENMKCKAYMRF